MAVVRKRKLESDAKQTFLCDWKIANYKNEESKYSRNEVLKSNSFFLEDGTEWILQLYPNGHDRGTIGKKYEDGNLSLYLKLETDGLSRQVEYGFSIIKPDGVAQSLLDFSSPVKFEGRGLPYGKHNLLKRALLFEKDSQYLQTDGSLHLQCQITLDGQPLVDGGGTVKLAKLRYSGKGSDFEIRSPQGKVFKVNFGVTS